MGVVVAQDATSPGPLPGSAENEASSSSHRSSIADFLIAQLDGLSRLLDTTPTSTPPSEPSTPRPASLMPQCEPSTPLPVSLMPLSVPSTPQSMPPAVHAAPLSVSSSGGSGITGSESSDDDGGDGGSVSGGWGQPGGGASNVATPLSGGTTDGSMKYSLSAASSPPSQLSSPFDLEEAGPLVLQTPKASGNSEGRDGDDDGDGGGGGVGGGACGISEVGFDVVGVGGDGSGGGDGVVVGVDGVGIGVGGGGGDDDGVGGGNGVGAGIGNAGVVGGDGSDGSTSSAAAGEDSVIDVTEEKVELPRPSPSKRVSFDGGVVVSAQEVPRAPTLAMISEGLGGGEGEGARHSIWSPAANDDRRRRGLRGKASPKVGDKMPPTISEHDPASDEEAARRGVRVESDTRRRRSRSTSAFLTEGFVRARLWRQMLGVESRAVSMLGNIVAENAGALDQGLVLPCAPTDEEKVRSLNRRGVFRSILPLIGLIAM